MRVRAPCEGIPSPSKLFSVSADGSSAQAAGLVIAAAGELYGAPPNPHPPHAQAKVGGLSLINTKWTRAMPIEYPADGTRQAWLPAGR